MKKVLLVLLLLTVAGGLFAQVTWNGIVRTGFNATLADGDTDWNVNWTSLTSRFQMTYRNSEGTFGGRLRLQLGLNGAAPSPFFNTYYGWFTMFDKTLKVLGGKWADGEFTELKWSGGEIYWSNARYGIQTIYYTPIEGLRLGIGSQAAALNGTTTFSDLCLWYGLAYEGDNFGVYLQGSIQDGDAASTSGTNIVLSGYVNIDPALVVLYADFKRLDDFDAKGKIALGQYVSLDVVEDVDIELYSEQTLYGNGDDAGVYVALGFGYNLDGPFPYLGLDLVCALSGDPTTGSAQMGIGYGKYLSFSPYLRFGLGAGSKYVELGYEGVVGFDDPSTFDNSLWLRFYWTF